MIGNSSAPTTIKMYEDFQCPICKEFEAATGAQVQAAVAAGKVKVDYHMVAFLDSHSTTNYSSRALNAAMAVLSTAGPDAFMKFHDHRLREPAGRRHGRGARLDADPVGRPGRARTSPRSRR